MNGLELRDKAQCSVFEARDAIARHNFRKAIKRAKTIEDIKTLLLIEFPENNLIKLFYPEEIVYE